ncbi:MAG: HAD-IA family hydrolase [bacterium]|nr:HAD-IA family hydrolase [bacterium]
MKKIIVLILLVLLGVGFFLYKNNLLPSFGKAPIRFVYFDVGEVLITNTNQKKREALVERFGLNPDSVEQAYHTIGRTGVDLGEGDDCSFWLSVARTAGLSQEQLQQNGPFICQLSPYIHLIEGSVAAFNAIFQQGLPVGILSNDSYAMGLAKADKIGYMDKAAAVVISAFYGVKKPGPEIYEIALQRAREKVGLDLTTGEILFVDDKADNITAAEQAGFRTILFQSSEQLQQELKDKFKISVLP